ncbi:hypothetical protein AB0M95_16835 [Sphaerisporangium sp. NPDC051017]|uniref:hypothetical protein n=1 Tax=Sphaerisporangium sp. NPDC051017 TaxID=3154636 RepID=UPI00341F1FBA
MRTRNRIPELTMIPFTCPTAISDYAKIGRVLSRDMREEFATASEERYHVLIRSFKGHVVLALLGALDVRLRARRVVKRLKRAAEVQAGSATEMVKFHAQFRKEFIDILPEAKPDKRMSPFNWNE